MSALTLRRLESAPTPFERLLLAASAGMTEFATERMRCRALIARRQREMGRLADAQTDAAAALRAGFLPR